MGRVKASDGVGVTRPLIPTLEPLTVGLATVPSAAHMLVEHLGKTRLGCDVIADPGLSTLPFECLLLCFPTL